jgi:orotidine-5'-phosphate decarboxylase
MPTELIVGLDLDTRDQALTATVVCRGCEWLKIGSQLFTRCGPQIVHEVMGLGKKVFLDLKYHDIPNTVASACRAAGDLGVSLLTLHASGGRKMIAAAREAVEGTEARLLAVTVLTSLSEEALRNEVGLPETPEAAVRRYAKQSVESGAHGIVCSPWEIETVREAVGPEPLIVTPGIRPRWSATDDQARIMTPREAAERGANFIVVSRPVLKHADPAEAIGLILEELNG